MSESEVDSSASSEERKESKEERVQNSVELPKKKMPDTHAAISNPLIPKGGRQASVDGDEKVESTELKGMSNQLVLQVTCASFLVFVIAEIIGALAGNSWSLLGDAAAMSVDVMSYFTNMIAERIKEKHGSVSEETRLILEVYIPSFSILSLLGVTAYVTVGAVGDIITKPADDDVDINMLWIFSSLNALVDILSGWMFYKKGASVFFQDLQADDESDVESGNGAANEEGRGKNLNMMSAFTHVGGDTMRTASVFVAAGIATWSGIPGYLCDAWAATVVTITIVIMVIPLCIEIVKAYNK